MEIVALEGDTAEGIGGGALYGDSLDAQLTEGGEFALRANSRRVPEASSRTKGDPCTVAIGGHGPQLREGDTVPSARMAPECESGADLNDAGQMLAGTGLVGSREEPSSNRRSDAPTRRANEMILRTGKARGSGRRCGDRGDRHGVLNNVQVGWSSRALHASTHRRLDRPPGETYNEGIYANRDGLLQLLIKQGDAITLGAGEVRTLRYFWMNRYSDNGFNDRGELLIEGYFDDRHHRPLLSNVTERAWIWLLVSGLVALGC